MHIWIDLSNSPHPLLFKPIARRLEALGHTVVITARDNAQTVELARERWPDVTLIGGPSPKGRRAKAQTIARRVADLRRWARATKPDVALSHNSYAQIVAARLLGIPVVTAMDFEHQPANHLAFRAARRVLVPEALQHSEIRRQGASRHKTHYYPGLKEEIYLSDFEPDAGLLARIGVDRSAGGAVVVARPAPDLALYHGFENPIFLQCVERVLRDPQTTVVVLPRHARQREALAELPPDRCIVPEHAVDSRSLMSQADLMIGAGGTMTREAALMGVPTFSLFAGRRPAVDIWLEQRGFLRTLRDVDDLPEVEPQPRADLLGELHQRGTRLIEGFCDAVVAA